MAEYIADAVQTVNPGETAKGDVQIEKLPASLQIKDNNGNIIVIIIRIQSPRQAEDQIKYRGRQPGQDLLIYDKTVTLRRHSSHGSLCTFDYFAPVINYILFLISASTDPACRSRRKTRFSLRFTAAP